MPATGQSVLVVYQSWSLKLKMPYWKGRKLFLTWPRGLGSARCCNTVGIVAEAVAVVAAQVLVLIQTGELVEGDCGTRLVIFGTVALEHQCDGDAHVRRPVVFGENLGQIEGAGAVVELPVGVVLGAEAHAALCKAGAVAQVEGNHGI